MSSLVRAKTLPPVLHDRVVSRPRLEHRVRVEAADASMVGVFGSPGTGKTTAVRQAINGVQEPIAWLALDEFDRTPGRLLLYLAAALDRVCLDSSKIVAEASADGLAPVEAAALLAEAIGDTPMLFVIDDLEKLRGQTAALAVLESFLRYRPSVIRVVLIGREEPFVPLMANSGRIVGHLCDSDLAFDHAEAAAALAGLGASEVDIDASLRSTRGWVAGVLLGTSGNRNGLDLGSTTLDSYIASQVLAPLSAPARDLLTDTVVLGEVTAEGAEALGIEAPGLNLEELRRKPLPVEWLPGGAFRAYPCLRDHLAARLRRRGQRQVSQLHEAAAMLLGSDGRREEAVEQLLDAGLTGPAARMANDVIVDLARDDRELTAKWLAKLPDEWSPSTVGITTARLLLAVLDERFDDAGEIFDGLVEAGDVAVLLDASPGALIFLVWALWHLARADEAEELLTNAPSVCAAPVSNILLTLARGASPRHISDPVFGRYIGVLAQRALYLTGHYQELLAGEADAGDDWWEGAGTFSAILGAKRAVGLIDEALELSPSADDRRRTVWEDCLVRPEILADALRSEAALDALGAGRQRLLESGSVMYELASLVAEAKISLRGSDASDAGLLALAAFERHPKRDEYPLLSEQADVWAGHSLLRNGDNATAYVRLRRAVDSMLQADRIAELPTAAIYLSEAAWRFDRGEEESDQAAQVALEAAARQGSNHVLLQALADFPAVLARALDIHPDTDSPWHRLARALSAHRGAPAARTPSAAVRMQEFGAASISVNGRSVRPRIRKSVELLGLLCARDGRDVSRDELLTVLFDGRADTSTRSYLRQAIHQLRAVLPGESVLHSDFGIVLDTAAVESDSVRFERLLSQAASLEGASALTLLRRALDLYESGEYLPCVDSGWVEERRSLLAVSAQSARMDAAELALGLGLHTDCESLLTASLAFDPMSERSWQLSMRLAGARGDDDGVLADFRSCSSELAKLGVEPSTHTYRIMRRMRGGPGSALPVSASLTSAREPVLDAETALGVSPTGATE